jgi:hypothetical protein
MLTSRVVNAALAEIWTLYALAPVTVFQSR